jgi:CubicO group peptidase (beta-lactamase class C family)
MKRRCFIGLLSSGAWAQNSGRDDLEALRKAHDLPALGAARFAIEGEPTLAVVGVRKRGDAPAVTIDDHWHLGSMTKAMTATLLATLVDDGKLTWETTLGEVIPNLLKDAVPVIRSLTIRQLLTHTAGLRANPRWSSWPRAEDRAALIAEQTKFSLWHWPLIALPGERHAYSNFGVMIAGHVAEVLTGQPWETAITERVFRKIGAHIGFGGTGTVGQVDQPWPHFENGRPTPTNGPAMDNPASLGPAGICHASLRGYLPFALDHLRGAAGKKALLTPQRYAELHTPQAHGDAAMGWFAVPRAWAGDRAALTHTGSNTMNFAVVWLAPAKGFGVMAVTNQAGSAAAKACDAACAHLIGVG